MTSAVGRVWHLETSMHYVFEDVELDAFDFGEMREAQTLSQEHERFAYVFEGPDAEEAADAVAELLRGPVPTMEDVWYGVRSPVWRHLAGRKDTLCADTP